MPRNNHFEYMIKSSKFEPYQILLIDDHKKNVIEAKNLGFQAIQYHGDIEKLKTDLKEVGIKISDSPKLHKYGIIYTRKRMRNRKI